jgi:hypothetical protein
MEPFARQFALSLLLLLTAIAVAILWASPGGWVVSAVIAAIGLLLFPCSFP